MREVDSIPIEASGFLDMDSFPDGSDLADDALVGLRAALLSDPVDEPGDDDWASLVSAAVDDADAAADGPFVVDDDATIAGVRSVAEDDPSPAAGPEAGPDDEGEGPADDGAVPGGEGTDLDLGDEVTLHDVVGLDLFAQDDDGFGALDGDDPALDAADPLGDGADGGDSGVIIEFGDGL